MREKFYSEPSEDFMADTLNAGIANGTIRLEDEDEDEDDRVISCLIMMSNPTVSTHIILFFFYPFGLCFVDTDYDFPATSTPYVRKPSKPPSNVGCEGSCESYEGHRTYKRGGRVLRDRVQRGQDRRDRVRWDAGRSRSSSPNLSCRYSPRLPRQ